MGHCYSITSAQVCLHDRCAEPAQLPSCRALVIRYLPQMALDAWEGADILVVGAD
jgi:hypothetical protein